MCWRRRGGGSHGRDGEKGREKETHNPSEITVELFNDRGETPRSHVEELPTPPHRPPVPSRRGVFVDGG